MNDFKKMPKMACGGGVKKYAAGGKIAKIAAGLAPAALMGAAVAPAAYKDLTSGTTAKMREAKEEKETEIKKEPEAKKKGGTVRRNKK
jgi:hypothetical protein